MRKERRCILRLTTHQNASEWTSKHSERRVLKLSCLTSWSTSGCGVWRRGAKRKCWGLRSYGGCVIHLCIAVHRCDIPLCKQCNATSGHIPHAFLWTQKGNTAQLQVTWFTILPCPPCGTVACLWQHTLSTIQTPSSADGWVEGAQERVRSKAAQTCRCNWNRQLRKKNYKYYNQYCS